MVAHAMPTFLFFMSLAGPARQLQTLNARTYTEPNVSASMEQAAIPSNVDVPESYRPTIGVMRQRRLDGAMKTQ